MNIADALTDLKTRLAADGRSEWIDRLDAAVASGFTGTEVALAVQETIRQLLAGSDGARISETTGNRARRISGAIAAATSRESAERADRKPAAAPIPGRHDEILRRTSR